MIDRLTAALKDATARGGKEDLRIKAQAKLDFLIEARFRSQTPIPHPNPGTQTQTQTSDPQAKPTRELRRMRGATRRSMR